MRKLAIMAALASTALATPAVAVDNSWYVGVEGGAMIVEDANLDFFFDDGVTVLEIEDAIQVDHKVGIDLDLIGGYDFGGFRVEAEAGWKRAALDEATIDGRLFDGTTVTGDVDGKVRVLSAMVNGLLDFGDDDGWNGYIGGGVGVARVKYTIGQDDLGDVSESDGTFAWQVIAGVR
ncbi:MAG TPA: outer membrane beta-barrel protein, partial [Sphingomicrobium sp.]|nr:outer membrane beta-barrel protein [Sphingomicrobium sp.]